MNTYLNLDESSLEITKVIKKEINKFKSDMSDSDFRKTIIELDEIDFGSPEGLNEADDDLIKDPKITHNQ
jgi:hypothetical protein